MLAFNMYYDYVYNGGHSSHISPIFLEPMKLNDMYKTNKSIYFILYILSSVTDSVHYEDTA